MHKNKDQILLENIYDNISNPSVGTNPPSGETSDYDRAEALLSDTLERLGVYADPSSEAYADAIRNLVATLENSPEEDQETAEKLAIGLDEPEQEQTGDDEQLGPDLDEAPSKEEMYQTQYESNTILNAYRQILGESKRKKRK